jgi:excisionase family DNA binding protein
MAEYLKLAEVARKLDVSEKTARRYVKSGELPSVFIGNKYRVSEDDLQEYVRGARVHPEGLPLPPSPPSPQWAMLAPDKEFDLWVKTADAMDLHKFFIEASKFSRGVEDAERRAHLLWRVQKTIDEFFRRFPVREIIDTRPRAAGEPGEKKSKGA